MQKFLTVFVCLLSMAFSLPATSLEGASNPNVVHVVLFHGQSNVTGVGGRPLQTDTPRQPTKNFSWNVGPRIVQPIPGDNSTDVKDLSLLTSIEPLREYDVNGPGGGRWAETAASGMLGRLTTMGVTNDLFAMNCGRGGRLISELNQGTEYWDFCLEALSKLKTVYAGLGRSIVVTAMVWSQGSGDRDLPEQDYYDLFVELVQDFQTDFKAVTGQFEPIRTLVLQDGSDGGGLFPDNPLPYGEAGEVNAQFQASIDYPDLIRIVAQQYPYEHAVDFLHLSGASQLWIGETMALAYYDWIWLGVDWQPLRPTHFEIAPNNTALFVYYTGNDGPTQFDLINVADSYVPTFSPRGFKLFAQCDPNSPLPLLLNAVNEPAQNRVRLSSAANLNNIENLCVSYGWNNGTTNPSLPGPVTGRRGNLRDNAGPMALYDATGLYGLPPEELPTLNRRQLDKWMVRFKLPVTWTDTPNP